MVLIDPDLLRPRAMPELGLGARAQEQASVFFTRPFLVVQYASRLYTARVALALALDLGWEERLRSGAAVDGLLEGMAPQARVPAEWMLAFLAGEGLLRESGGRYFLDGDPDLGLAEIRAIVDREAPGHGANFDLLDAVRVSVKPFFLEGKPGEQLLFGPEVFPLWLAFFRNENLGYLPNNLLTVFALREALESGSRILEIGGGAGSLAQLVARDGAAEGYLSRIAEYRFTDITPTFLRMARRDLGAKAPGLPFTFGSLDINKPFAEQGFAESTFDAVVGVNVVHVATDLQQSLRNLRSLLKPGGRLILGECLKPDLAAPIFLEFFFKFMKSFTEVQLDPVLRPCSGFLTPEIWEAALRAAGFQDVRPVPDSRALMRAFPAFYVGAFAARRG